MAQISVNVKNLKRQESGLLVVSAKLRGIEAELRFIQKQLSAGKMSETYRSIAKKIGNTATAIEYDKKIISTMKTTLGLIENTYSSTERGIVSGVQKIGKVDWTQTYAGGVATETGTNPFAAWYDDFKEVSILTDDDKDVISIIKTILKIEDSWGDNDDAGVLHDLIDYFENLFGFFAGDKKGLDGFAAWFGLADSSVGLWTGAYDYFRNIYSGVETGFFGKAVQKNVKVVGFAAGFMGLISSVLSASSGLNEKQWQSIVADYVSCGKDVFSIIGSGYSLKHIGDVKSLIEMKAGPWNALNIYEAIAKSGVDSVAQVFRSHEKYYADDQWDTGDTGATGIDVSMTGLYGLSHNLTLGVDDWFFSLVDKISGGNGNGDMSYAEKAAEGYKILAEKCGEIIGGWFR